ncbi:uncharacterized protein LOC111332808 isoform X1 [Stylophora pistillata]|uniref:uncharacterized protein LOC111332808 isoform X1 n=1 Tax=Stylophora pistillata TaxID=50429 RepID=UPI000C03C45A|nr:uncharacterized protein LOC111332808 isoform X1 [Stylophora pistillata]
MYSGLTSLVKRPSSSLKEKLEARLESHKDSMDILAMVLRIDVTQGRTVREVIAIAEEKNGELFLVTWRFIFELLGLTKDFEELVDADHWPMTDPIKTLENPLPDQYPRDSNHTTHHRSLHEYAQYSNKPEEPLSNKFKEPRLKNAEGYAYLHSILDLTHHRTKLTSRLQSGSGGTVEESQKTRSSSLNWPEQSLPPPSEDNLSHKTWKQTTVTVEVRDDDGKPPPSEDNLSHNTCKETTGTVETRKDDRKHHDPQVDKAKERKVSDGQDLQQIQNDDSPFSSPAILPVLVVPASQLEQSTGNDSRCLTWQVNSDHAELKAPESQCQQAVAPDLGEGIDEEDNSGSASQVDTIPSSVYSMTSSRGSSTGSSTGSRPVTHERANIPVGLVTVQQSHLNPLAGQERVSEVLGETGRPSENDDTFGNSDDLQQICPFQLRDIVFLIQSLRERSSELAACQLELQSCRQQCGQQQGDIKELCDMKDQEIGRLAQLCDQKDQDNERLTEVNLSKFYAGCSFNKRNKQ